MRAITTVFLAIALVASFLIPFPVSAADSPCIGVTEIPQSECLGLEALFDTTNGAGWVNHTNWFSNLTPSNWYGVWVSGGHVTQLLLNSNNLTGYIPNALGNLTYLTRIEMGFNALSGSLPSTLVSLSSLQYFQVVDNDLSGAIPAFIGTLTYLHDLLLSGNQFSGAIPPELGNLTNLVDLRVDRNNLSGYLPDELGNLTNLVTFYVNGNDLTGSIPLTYTKLTSVLEFHFYQNNLCEPNDPEFQAWKATIPPEGWWSTGSICEDYYCQSREDVHEQECRALVSFYIDTNGNEWTYNANWLSFNPIDTWYGIGAFGGHIYEIYLPENNLAGPIPGYIDDLSQLEFLYLPNNHLSGVIPPDMGNLAKLLGLYLDSNEITGELPVELSQLTGLIYFGVSENQLTGNIPFEFGALENLEYANFSYNPFTGSIPLSFVNLHSMATFAFIETNLCEVTTPEFVTWKSSVVDWFGTGALCQDIVCPSVSEIPQAECNALVSLYYSTNGDEWLNHTNWLVTTTPPGNWYGVTVISGNVQTIYLPSNNLHGYIPSDVSNFTQLYGLKFGFNNLSGPIPASLGSLPSLHRIELLNNKLSGPIPPELGNITSLEVLNLSYNQLTGSIPPQLGNLTNLFELRLNKNQLSGTIPASLSNLPNLYSFYLSDNQLTGSLPAEFGTLSYLYDLRVNNNPLAGSIPMQYTTLINMDHFYFFNTNLCEPSDPLYATWKISMEDYNGSGIICKYCFLPIITR